MLARYFAHYLESASPILVPLLSNTATLHNGKVTPHIAVSLLTANPIVHIPGLDLKGVFVLRETAGGSRLRGLDELRWTSSLPTIQVPLLLATPVVRVPLVTAPSIQVPLLLVTPIVQQPIVNVVGAFLLRDSSGGSYLRGKDYVRWSAQKEIFTLHIVNTPSFHSPQTKGIIKPLLVSIGTIYNPSVLVQANLLITAIALHEPKAMGVIQASHLTNTIIVRTLGVMVVAPLDFNVLIGGTRLSWGTGKSRMDRGN